ncbi:MAG: DMT family transporter [Acidobacteriota bacterium]
MPLSRFSKGLLAAGGAASLWAVGGVTGKVLLTSILSPAQLVFLRSALSTLVLGLFLLLTQKPSVKVRASDLPFLACIGIFGLAFTQFTYYAAIQSLPVGLGILLQYLAPVWILLFEWIGWKLPLTKTKVTAVGLSVCGCGLVSIQNDSGTSYSAYGVSMGLIAGVCFAAYGLMNRRALRHHADVTVLFYSLLFCTVFWGIGLLPAGLPWARMNGVHWAMVWYIALLGTLIPFWLFVRALRYLEASQVGTVSTLEPVLAAALAWFRLGETLAVSQLVGGMLVLMAILTLHQSSPRKVEE